MIDIHVLSQLFLIPIELYFRSQKNNFWTPTLAKGSYNFSPARPSACLPFRSNS